MHDMIIDDLIVAGMMNNEEYARKIAPHVLPEYFSDPKHRALFTLASNYFQKFNKLPTADVLKIGSRVLKDFPSHELGKINEMIDAYAEKEQQDTTWMTEQTETFCKDRAIYNAIMDSISIIDGSDNKRGVDALPSILQEALSVSFNTAVGHSYLMDAEARYALYSKEEARVPFDIDILNYITGGGLSNKSLTVLLAQSGGGKSLVMCHMAAGMLRSNKNVLYISMEMAEEKIAERIDANLLDTPINKLQSLGKDKFMTKIDGVSSKTKGRLFIKEYPSGRAHSGHFRALLSELKTKQDFVPDVIFVDYLGICASSTVKMGQSVNTYVYLKYVAEELRALAMEHDLPIVTAGQVNRNGYNNSDMELTDISDSLSIVMTADLILGVIRSEELDASNQLMMVQMKNRYRDPADHKRFLVGVDRSKMKLMGLDEAASTGGLMKEPDLAKAMQHVASEAQNSTKPGGFIFSKRPGVNLGSLNTNT